MMYLCRNEPQALGEVFLVVHMQLDRTGCAAELDKHQSGETPARHVIEYFIWVKRLIYLVHGTAIKC